MISRLTPQDWETISAYLDGQLSEKEKRQVQDLIALRPELKQGLEDLRRTRAVLRAAPRRRAPRNFTLTPEMAQKARPRFRWGWTPSFSFASAMAAILLVLSFFFRVNLAQLSYSMPMAAQAPVAASQENAAGSNPPIIIWNAPGVGGAPSTGAVGMGGGNDSTQKLVAPSPSDSQAVPGTTPMPDVPPALAAAATPEPTTEAALTGPSEPQSTPEGATSKEAGGNNPILGIAPTEEQGRMIVPEKTVNDQARQFTEDRWIYVQIGLAGVVLIFALAAFFTWRKSHH